MTNAQIPTVNVENVSVRPLKSPPYFPFWERDFVHSCRCSEMMPDEVGALVMVMCQQWENMGPLASDPARFAAYTGWDIRQARRLLARLTELRKIQTTPAGIESSRMREEIEKYVAKVRAAELREARKAKIDRTSSELQANFPRKSERSSAELSEKHHEINETQSREAPLPEPDSEPDNRKKNIRAARAAPVDEQFEEFWNAFPVERRRGKGKVRDLFAQIVSGHHKSRHATAAEIIFAVRAGNGIDPNFPPMPETWLNQGRWEDGAVNGGNPAPVNGVSWGWWRGKEDRLRGLSLERWREGFVATKPNGTWPWWVFGPPPGHAECFVPQTIIVELNLTEKYNKDGISKSTARIAA